MTKSRGIGRGKWRERGVCSVEYCDNPHYGKGWCHKHYQQVRAHGDITEPPAPKTRRCLTTKCKRKAAPPLPYCHICWQVRSKHEARFLEAEDRRRMRINALKSQLKRAEKDWGFDDT